jgi:hypothetical protein
MKDDPSENNYNIYIKKSANKINTKPIDLGFAFKIYSNILRKKSAAPVPATSQQHRNPQSRKRLGFSPVVRIETPHPLTRRRVCPPLVQGDTLACRRVGGGGGGEVPIRKRDRHCGTLGSKYICAAIPKHSFSKGAVDQIACISAASAGLK